MSDLNERQRISEKLVRVYELLDVLDNLGDVAGRARDGMRVVADAQEVVRRFALNEAAIRADERARIVADLVEEIGRIETENVPALRALGVEHEARARKLAALFVREALFARELQVRIEAGAHDGAKGGEG